MKKCILLSAMGIIILIIAFNIKPIMRYTSEFFWDFVCEQLDKEEAERQKRIEAGLPIRGKDTALIWRDKYDICKSSNTKLLMIYIDGDEQVVLDKVKDFDVYNKTLYVLSDDGYAVIDNENNCRVFIFTPKEELEYTSQHYGSIEDEHIKYLSSYEEFSKNEREIFEKLSK